MSDYFKDLEAKKKRAVDLYTDEKGRWRTKSLFIDTTLTAKKYTPPFTLKEHSYEFEGNYYQSLREKYLEYRDPTEYEFAIGVFKSWAHWKRIRDLEWFQEYITSWREELEILLRSEGIKKTAELAANGNPNATKWLAEAQWLKDSKRGRPSKDQISREARILGKVKADTEEDFERLGLRVVNN